LSGTFVWIAFYGGIEKSGSPKEKLEASERAFSSGRGAP
jgi:hypothetical protein